jgi:hypothetical protein
MFILTHEFEVRCYGGVGRLGQVDLRGKIRARSSRLAAPNSKDKPP